MTLMARRGLIKGLGLLPLARTGKHRHKETPVGWSNQAFQLLIFTSEGPGSGEFGYSPGPGYGNLIFSNTATAGVDAYGNAYVEGTTNYTQPASGPFPFVAISLIDGGLTWYSATSAAGPWVALANLLPTQIGGVDAVDFTTAVQFPNGQFLLEQATAPATPSGGGWLYVDSTGHLHYLGPGGTNTTLAGP